MSLIGDALRKTRQEAAEREVDQKGVLFSAKIADSPTRSHLGLGLALGAVIAVAATVAGGGAVWWLLGRVETTRTGPPKSAAPAATVIVENTEAPIQTPSSPTAETRMEAQAIPSVEDTSASSIRSDPVDLAPIQATAEPTVIVDTAKSRKSEDKNLSEGFVGIEDGDEVYILEANLGKVHLSLDFIVFRPDDPFTEINGVELHVGGVIDGYRVKAIERDRVRLSNGRRSIVLRAP